MLKLGLCINQGGPVIRILRGKKEPTGNLCANRSGNARGKRRARNSQVMQRKRERPLGPAGHKSFRPHQTMEKQTDERTNSKSNGSVGGNLWGIPWKHTGYPQRERTCNARLTGAPGDPTQEVVVVVAGEQGGGGGGGTKNGKGTCQQA